MARGFRRVKGLWRFTAARPYACYLRGIYGGHPHRQDDLRQRKGIRCERTLDYLDCGKALGARICTKGEIVWGFFEGGLLLSRLFSVIPSLAMKLLAIPWEA